MIIGSFDIGERNFAYSIGSLETLQRFRRCDVIKKKKQTIIESCQYISEILENEDWSQCDLIIIEHQMRTNIRAQRLGQHVWTWFSTKFPDTKPSFVPSHMKTQFFLGKNKLTDATRKRWSITKATEILTERGDEDNLTYLKGLEKKDDVSDTLLQLIAFLSKDNKNEKKLKNL